MLNCLGRTSHQYHPVKKPKKFHQAKPVTQDQPALPDLELKELVVDMPGEQESTKEELTRVTLVESKPNKAPHLIENVSISINNGIGVNIGKCDVATLSALIREMEVMR